MAATPDGLGRLFNVVHDADGVGIKLVDGTAVTFVSFLADGSQTIVLTQRDSSGVNSEIDLNVFGLDPENRGSRVYAGPATGGSWTEVTSSSSNNDVDGSDSTNDTLVVTVRAEQLADGYDTVEATSATGTVTAILHDLTVQRKPSNLRSVVVA